MMTATRSSTAAGTESSVAHGLVSFILRGTPFSREVYLLLRAESHRCWLSR